MLCRKNFILYTDIDIIAIWKHNQSKKVRSVSSHFREFLSRYHITQRSINHVSLILTLTKVNIDRWHDDTRVKCQSIYAIFAERHTIRSMREYVVRNAVELTPIRANVVRETRGQLADAWMTRNDVRLLSTACVSTRGTLRLTRSRHSRLLPARTRHIFRLWLATD
jgi:hypothetical protein